MAISLRTMVSGTKAAAEDVNFNDEQLRAAVEGIGGAQANADAYQTGILILADWNLLSTLSINSSTGSIASTAVGGSAWLPGATGLVRTFTPAATVSGLTPTPTASGNYRKVGIEIEASGTTAKVSLVSGVEKASEAEAIAASPAITSGRARLIDGVVHNTAGVYTLVALRDRRRWALGAFDQRLLVETKKSTSTTLTPIDFTNLALRLECSGRPVRVTVIGNTSKLSGGEFDSVQLGCFMDGAAVGAVSASKMATGEGRCLVFSQLLTAVPAGSHFFQAAWATAAGSIEWAFNAESLHQFTVEEILRFTANNGTS